MGSAHLLEVNADIVTECFRTFSIYNGSTDQISFNEISVPNLVNYRCNYPGQDIRRGGVTRIAFLMDFENDCSLMANKLQGIFIHPNLRGNGYGRELVSIMENITRRHGLGSVQLRDVGNPRFWEHMGYEHLAALDYCKILSKSELD
jgi:GNAT superfamily N-acetyltransferase